MNIVISIARQTLEVFTEGHLVKRYPVSTAKAGGGEQRGSYQTPRGRHVIRAKIGDGAPVRAVFVARRFTGEVWSPKLAEEHPHRDWVLSRILWLSGCEPGRNRLGDRDTMRRYIYIHGTPDTAVMGEAASHGCIRMNNEDVIDLFDRVPIRTPVDIVED